MLGSLIEVHVALGLLLRGVRIQRVRSISARSSQVQRGPHEESLVWKAVSVLAGASLGTGGEGVLAGELLAGKSVVLSGGCSSSLHSGYLSHIHR